MALPKANPSGSDGYEAFTTLSSRPWQIGGENITSSLSGHLVCPPIGIDLSKILGGNQNIGGKPKYWG